LLRHRRFRARTAPENLQRHLTSYPDCRRQMPGDVPNCRKHVTELASRLRAIHTLLTDCEALTITLPVAASYAS